MIRIVEDVGAPALVTIVDIGTETMAPQWNEWASYLMTLVGYGGAFMGMGGEFIKNVGIASFPLAAKKLYHMVTAGGATRRVSRYPSPSVIPQFGGVKLV